jgi:hypothetical protein
MGWRFAGSLAVVAFCAGCSPKPVVDVPKVTDHASVGYSFLLDPSVQRPAGTFVPPSPREELRLPVYPPDALAARAGAASVSVRIVIDTEGRIANVTDSPLEASSAGPFASEFHDAVLRSLRHWRFTPGRIEQSEDGPGYRTITSMEAVRVFYDVRFDFDVVSGEGRVRTSASTAKGESSP